MGKEELVRYYLLANLIGGYNINKTSAVQNMYTRYKQKNKGQSMASKMVGLMHDRRSEKRNRMNP